MIWSPLKSNAAILARLPTLGLSYAESRRGRETAWSDQEVTPHHAVDSSPPKREVTQRPRGHLLHFRAGAREALRCLIPLFLLNKGAGCGDPQSLQHALNKIESLFPNEVLVYP